LSQPAWQSGDRSGLAHSSMSDRGKQIIIQKLEFPYHTYILLYYIPKQVRPSAGSI